MIDKIEGLTKLLAEGEPDRINDFRKFWNEWFNDTIPGEKHTIYTERNGEIVGVVRLWHTPYINIGYLVEGLEVSERYRMQGIGKELLLKSEAYLRSIGEEYIFSGTYNKNVASINTHISAGFVDDDRETLNSYGTLQNYLRCFKKKL